MNAQNGLMVVLGLGALAGIGYAVASSGKDATPAGPSSPPPPDTGPLPSYVPQALVDAYQQCYNMGGACPPITYQQVQAGLSELMVSHPEESPLWTYFATELERVYSQSGGQTSSASDPIVSQSPGLGLNFGAQSVASQSSTDFLDLGALGSQTGTPLPLPATFPATLSASYTKCWYELCQQAEFDTLIAGMQAYMNRTDITTFSRQQVQLAMTASYSRRMYLRGFGTQGVTGRHTGGCSCQARQEEVGTGACCDSCAKGEECSECGNHAPAVG